jgi:beta-lactamase regulating signal transducer with metallopeptidase domain
MTNSFIYYVLESSICLLLFLMVYRLLIANLTHFSWMRIYLLISVILSLILPLIILPVQWNSSIHTANLFNFSGFLTGNISAGSYEGQSLSNDSGNNISIVLLQGMLILLFAVYISGLLYKASNLARNLRSINKCIKQNPKVKEGRFWLVDLNKNVPPFSFFNYIFITNSGQRLSADELQRIKDHEKVHSQQFHSLDVLFVEVISIIFWFNPLLNYLKKSIQEIHEYIVDEKIAERGKGKKDYAELLLKLASDVKGFNLSAGFSGSQIKRRIVMISRQRSLPGHKLMFIILVPLTLLLMLSFSYIKNPDHMSSQKQQNGNVNQSQLKIGKIIWKGNTVYDVKTLNDVFGLKTGSLYNQSLVEDRLNGTSGAQDAVSNLYQDNGYLFSRITNDVTKNNEIVDLIITINEGKRFKFNDIIVKIDGVITKDPVSEIGIHKGDLFNKAKIVQAIRALVASGKYDPEKISPKPIPNVTSEEFDNVDLIFELTKISNKK